MSRPAVLVVMILALLWQAVTYVRGDVASGRVTDLAHAALHWQNEAHHHHDGDTYHLDDSAESARHALGDHGNVNATPGQAFVQDLPLLVSAAPRGPRVGPAPHPFLAGLLRPPRPQA